MSGDFFYHTSPYLFRDRVSLKYSLTLNSQRSACLCLPSVGNKGVCHHPPSGPLPYFSRQLLSLNLGFSDWLDWLVIATHVPLASPFQCWDYSHAAPRLAVQTEHILRMPSGAHQSPRFFQGRCWKHHPPSFDLYPLPPHPSHCCSRFN